MAVKYLSYIVLYDYPAYQDLQDDCITVCGSLSWVSHGFAVLAAHRFTVLGVTRFAVLAAHRFTVLGVTRFCFV